MMQEANRNPLNNHLADYRRFFNFFESGADIGKLFDSGLTHPSNPGDEPQNRILGITPTDAKSTYTRAGLLLVYPKDEIPIYHGIQQSTTSGGGSRRGPVFEVPSGRGLELWAWLCLLTSFDASQITRSFGLQGVMQCNVYGSHDGYDACVTNANFGSQSLEDRKFENVGNIWTYRESFFRFRFNPDSNGICTVNCRLYAGRFIQFCGVIGYVHSP